MVEGRDAGGICAGGVSWHCRRRVAIFIVALCQTFLISIASDAFEISVSVFIGIKRSSPDHPLRAVREIVDPALAQLSRAFDKLYAQEGRPSIPLERPLRAVAPSLLYDSESVLCLKCWLG